MTKLKVFESFAGVGSQAMALRNIGSDYEVVGTSDWDINATLSYNAIHKENTPDYSKNITIDKIEEELFRLSISSDGKKPLTLEKIKRLNENKKREIYNAFKNVNNMGSIVSIDPQDIPDHDLFTYSFPCQDISLAGKQRGLDDNSTRSGLLWECEKVINVKRPKYLLLENVKNLVGIKHRHNFDKWLEILEGYGYTNYWKVLNAKDYGIPQNRERVFVVSILGEHEPYKFPEKQELQLRLKDLLEDEVDEKFYLDDDRVAKLKFDLSKVSLPSNELKVVGNTSATNYNKSNVYHDSVISPTIAARDYKGPNQVLQVGQYNTDTRNNSNRFRTYSVEGTSPSLTTMGGGGLEPCVLIKNGTKQGYSEVSDGDGIDLDYPDSKTRSGMVQKEISKTLQTDDSIGTVELIGGIGEKNFGNQYRQGNRIYNVDKIAAALTANPVGNAGGNSYLYSSKEDVNFRIRKLTPLECWRLMGFTDEDFYKAQAIHSNSTLYKQAGNSIVVSVLEGIFTQLLKIHNNKEENQGEYLEMTGEIKRPNKKIVVLDFETNGFSSLTNEVTEVGAVTIDGKTGEITNVFDSIVKINGTIPQKVVELTGITKELTQTHGLPFEVVKAYLQQICKDAIVVAHNVQFDFSFLKHQFDIEPQFYYDTLTISRALYPGEKSHKLGDICERSGIILSGAHRALNDVYATVELLNKQLNKPDVAMKYMNVVSGYRGVKFRPENTREVI